MAEAITIKDGITPAMQEMAKQFPVEMPKAMISLGQWLRKRIASEARAGAPAQNRFGPLAAITMALRTARSPVAVLKRARRSSAAVKSILSQRDVREIQEGFGGELTGGSNPYGLIAFRAFKQGRDFGVSVGFMDEFSGGSARAASRFQSATGQKPITPQAHKWLRLRLGKDYQQPRMWPAKPARMIFDSYVNDPVLGQEKLRVLATAITRIRESAMAKAARA
jgi:hypothetical protein